MKTPFVDFYAENKTSPVSIDIFEFKKHFQKRGLENTTTIGLKS